MTKKAGIDLGSRFVKMAVAKNNKIIRREIFPTIEFYTKFRKRKSKKMILDTEKLDLKNTQITTTGYGRNNIKDANPITEIIAHAKGAVFQTGLKDFTLLDIGGQDNKVILVKSGIVSDFKINDRCAAGSGKYFENMAHTLHIPLEKLFKAKTNPAPLHATCTVFAETEMIGQIASGASIASLAAGVNFSVFSRIKPDLVSLLKGNPLVFVGGSYNNKGLIYFIEKHLKTKVIIPKYPHINAAIGCLS